MTCIWIHAQAKKSGSVCGVHGTDKNTKQNLEKMFRYTNE